MMIYLCILSEWGFDMELFGGFGLNWITDRIR